MQKGTLGEEGTGEKWRLLRRCLLPSSILQFGNIGGEGREGKVLRPQGTAGVVVGGRAGAEPPLSPPPPPRFPHLSPFPEKQIGM